MSYKSKANRLIGTAYADLILQVLEINAKPMRCQEISQEISEHSDFPELSSQYVRRQMMSMIGKGEIVRIEETTYYPKHKTVYFALPSVVEEEKEEEDETADALIEGIVGGVKAFTIDEDGKWTKLF